MSISEKRSLPPAFCGYSGWKKRSSGELQGLAPSSDSPCFALSTLRWEEGPPLWTEIPGRAPFYTQDRLAAGRKQVSTRPTQRGKSDLHGAENSPASWVFQLRAFEPFPS